MEHYRIYVSFDQLEHKTLCFNIKSLLVSTNVFATNLIQFNWASSTNTRKNYHFLDQTNLQNFNSFGFEMLPPLL